MLLHWNSMVYSWEGSGDQELGKDASSGKVRVRGDPRYYRPTEVELLVCLYYIDIYCQEKTL